jgi:hypothetical protein
MKRFSSNITGLYPVTKKTSPTKVNQKKQKKEQNRSSPELSRESRKPTTKKKQLQTTTYHKQNILLRSLLCGNPSLSSQRRA